MLQDEIVESAAMELALPVVLALKKNGGLHFCVDYKRLNDTTVHDSYQVSKMDERFNSLESAAIFSTLDVNSDYGQIEMDEKDRDETAFVTFNGL